MHIGAIITLIYCIKLSFSVNKEKVHARKERIFVGIGIIMILLGSIILPGA